MEDTVKPICVIYFPKYFSFGKGGSMINPLDLMKELNGWGNIEHKGTYEGYVWFCFHKESINEPELKVFYSKDFSEVEVSEIKEMVINYLNDTVGAK